ncbi:hypothetical protein Bsp3421_000151 (plasmid) [Burkholderia sp. FERM BP-3421]|nr:hypothetical protein [Burkholderia sp. FERM BP-3421]WDD90326.1 hypothetical protein Bsp3421_000151 [Burkholderia sp. FERM BP-3421]
MDRPTKAVIGMIVALCVICIGAGIYYFHWQGIDTSIANDRDYPKPAVR